MLLRCLIVLITLALPRLEDRLCVAKDFVASARRTMRTVWEHLVRCGTLYFGFVGHDPNASFAARADPEWGENRVARFSVERSFGWHGTAPRPQIPVQVPFINRNCKEDGNNVRLAISVITITA